jgi:hypothetical protein
LNDLIITQDLKIYSHYIVENVKKVPMSYEYFDISDSTIKIKEKYRNVLQGKITLPSVDSTSASIKIIGDF